MPLTRTEITAESREEARRLLELYRKGGHDQALEAEVTDDVVKHGFTPRGRPRLAGSTNGNPPILFFDTDVYPDVSA
ncbi:hypothetical protein GCM10009676_01220 [Prauserella halophila]|uniref:Uncharacterized protein n=1 Tax=Prauserella halophila TaxID=185641 RepID=A0ABN1VU72_9PSEU|nr:hypothetical protein [Prauserella halophila]MCP2234534.1 hypothetical protein [Prauserella halophila]